MPKNNACTACVDGTRHTPEQWLEFHPRAGTGHNILMGELPVRSEMDPKQVVAQLRQIKQQIDTAMPILSRAIYLVEEIMEKLQEIEDAGIPKAS